MSIRKFNSIKLLCLYLVQHMHMFKHMFIDNDITCIYRDFSRPDLGPKIGPFPIKK